MTRTTAAARSSRRAKPVTSKPRVGSNGSNGAHVEPATVARGAEEVFDATFPGYRAARAEDAPVLRRDVASVLPGEFQDADFASLVYTLAGAEGHTKGIADAACHKGAAELQVVRHVLESRAFGHDSELDAALIVMVDGLSQRLHAAGEIERRRLEARKGEVTP